MKLQPWIVRMFLWSRFLRRRRLWALVSDFDPNWKRRIALMARYIDRPGLVADFGCGPMWLEQFLPAGSTYLPIDYIRRDERTIVIDLNRDLLPPLHAHVAFLSGVLEYVHDVDAVVRQLERQEFTRLIVSYNTVERVPQRFIRRAINWVSDIRLEDLLSWFCRCFFLVELQIIDTNTILVFDRKVAPSAYGDIACDASAFEHAGADGSDARR